MSSRIARAFPFRAFHLALIATLLLEPMSASARSSSTKSKPRARAITAPAKRSLASAPSHPSPHSAKLGLPHRALMRLPTRARRELIRAYIEALIRYERAHPTRLASEKNSEGISLAELLDLASDSVFPLAFAGERCISAGWTGEMRPVGGRTICRLPPQADEYRKSCSGGQEPCNPGLFGGYGAGRAACIDRSGSQNFTDRCEAKARAERQSGALKQEPWEYESEYQNVSENLDSVTRDRDRYLQKDVARIMSENKERLAGFTDDGKKKGNGGSGSNSRGIASAGGSGNGGDDDSMDLAQADDTLPATPPGSGEASGNSAAQKEGTFTQNDDPSIGNSESQSSGQATGSPGGAPTPGLDDTPNDLATEDGTQFGRGAGGKPSVILPDGTRVDSQGNVQSLGRGTKGRRDRYDYEEHISSDDDCKVGATIDDKYACGTTRAVVEGGKVANAVAQGAGAAAQQVMGMQSQMDLMKKGGNQGDSLRAGAKLQDTAANMQLGIGAMNTALGAFELYKAYQHKKNKDELDQGYRGHGMEANRPDAPASDLEQYKQYDLSGDGKSFGRAQSKQGASDAQNAPATAESGGAQKNLGQHGFLSSNKEVGGKIIENFNINDVKSLSKVTVTDGDVQTAKASATEARAKAEAAKATPAYAQLDALAKQRETELAQITQKRVAEIARRESELDQKMDIAERNIKTIGRRAKGEQETIANEATGAGIQSIVSGAQQLITGFFNKKSAAMMKDAANSFQAPSGAGFKPIQPIINPGDPLAPRSPTVIGGSTATPENAEASDEEVASDGNTLGDPPNIGGNPDGLQNQAPNAGRFIAGDPDKGGGGAGGGNLGGGGTSPSQGGGDDPGARMADNRESAAYAGGGGGGYGGGGRGAGGSDKGPDLSGLLAQFLPKGEDEKGGKNGILDFGGREPHGPEDSGAFFDKTTNLFERIHDTYQEKQRKRNVGI